MLMMMGREPEKMLAQIAAIRDRSIMNRSIFYIEWIHSNFPFATYNLFYLFIRLFIVPVVVKCNLFTSATHKKKKH